MVMIIPLPHYVNNFATKVFGRKKPRLYEAFEKIYRPGDNYSDSSNLVLDGTSYCEKLEVLGSITIKYLNNYDMFSISITNKISWLPSQKIVH